METRVKSRILDGPAVGRALMRITHEILERNNGTDRLCLIGIRTRDIVYGGGNIHCITQNRPAAATKE